jgi:hypothetical protein
MRRKERIERLPDVMPERAKDLFVQLRGYLIRCSVEGAIRDSQSEVRSRLRHYEEKGQQVVAVCDAPTQPKNFRRDRALAFFTRADGAWFDFGFTVTERGGRPLELHSYGGEVRFDGSTVPMPPPWIRFDLNPLGTSNDDRAQRSHLHPGTDDWSVPSPILSPIELLDLLVFGCSLPPGRAPRI